MVGVQFATAGRGVAGLTPALAGILAASSGFAIVFLSRIRAYEPQQAV